MAWISSPLASSPSRAAALEPAALGEVELGERAGGVEVGEALLGLGAGLDALGQLDLLGAGEQRRPGRSP